MSDMDIKKINVGGNSKMIKSAILQLYKHHYIETHESLRAILIQTSTLKYVLLYHVSYKVYCLCLLKSVYCYVVYLQKESNLMQSLCLPFLFTFSPASFNLMSVQIKPIESHNRILWTYKLHVILQNMPIL